MGRPKAKKLRWLGLGICGIFLFFIISLFPTATSAFFTASFPSGELSIVLDDALWRKSQETIAFADIQLDFDCQKHTCSSEIWGYAANFNQADHEGKLVKLTQHSNQIQFQIQMHLNRDKWSQEGEADYSINLKQNGNKLEGNYTGTHNGRSVQGQAFGIVQKQLKTIPNFVPIQPGEHPRLLFRQQDISALHSKAKTPIGKQIIANLIDALTTRPDRNFPANDALAYGLLYQLTNNTKYAKSAREILISRRSCRRPRRSERRPAPCAPPARSGA